MFIALVSVVFWVFDKQLRDPLTLHQSGIQAGHYWSFITANLMHTNTAHLLLNLGGLVLLWAVHGYSYSIITYLAQFICFALAVTLGMAYLSPDFAWYAGLSGVLHGIFVVGAYHDIKQKIKFGWWLMIGVWLKVLYEQLFGADQSIRNLIEANVAIDAHLYGAAAGSVWVIVSFIKANKSRSIVDN